MLEHILLEQEQEELLVLLVEAARSLPREKRQKFWVSESFGNLQAQIIHPGLPRDSRAPRGDIEILATQGLVLLTYGRHGTPMFDVTPLGFKYYEALKIRQSESTDRLEQAVKEYLGGAAFGATYPTAFTKWQSAEQQLWSSDSILALTTIGHLCRESMQEFATAVVQRFAPDPVDPDKAHTVSRLRSVINKASSAKNEAEREVLNALLVYWGAVADLVQRQEHGAAKEGNPLVWEDARRVVFQTAVVMFEIGRALESAK